MTTEHSIRFVCFWETIKKNGFVTTYSHSFDNIESMKNYVSKHTERLWKYFIKDESWTDENNVHCGKAELVEL